jgi:hypothetical protein
MKRIRIKFKNLIKISTIRERMSPPIPLVMRIVICEVTFRPSIPGSTRWLCRSTFAINEGKNASIILNARLRL